MKLNEKVGKGNRLVPHSGESEETIAHKGGDLVTTSSSQ